jgi:predicted ATPase
LHKPVNQLKYYHSKKIFDVDTAFVIPLISRTKSIVEDARKLEDDRKRLFEPLTRFEEIVDSFLNQKNISINDNGKLIVTSIATNQELQLQFLSSGEKQILILLTQALLWEDKPVIYVADEPELSLHVLWQEKLLSSLVELSKNIQIIVATHSPDIVGPYINKVIDLGENQK